MPRALGNSLKATAAIVALSLAACSSKEGQVAAAGPPVVKVATVSTGEVQITDTLPGRVVAFRVAEIRPQVSGLVQRRLFTEGALVRAGQPLYQINAAPFRAEAASASASLRRAEASRNLARVQRDRLRPLVEADAVSRQTFDEAEALLAQAEADVGVARANLARRTLDVGFATVTAPISGRIGASTVTEGALVSATGGEPLASINQIGQVYVDVSQPAARMVAVRELGQGSTTVELLDDAGQSLGLSGRLLFSDVVVDPATGDMRARVQVQNADDRLLPGMFVRVRLPRGPQQNLLRVPQQAVTHTGGKPQVLVVMADGKIQSRVVQLGDVVNNHYVVLSGVTAGERVVVEGQDRARPGVAVRPTPWRGSADAASSPAA